MTAYLVHGRRIGPDDAGWGDALAAAHANRHRPQCLCQPEALEMYVARVGTGFAVKRMPFTGHRHAPDCPSYEPPPELSGLGQVMGSAIAEDPSSGITSLRLGFSMSKGASRLIDPGAGTGSDSAKSGGTKLTLRGLLHYLWDQAGLARWQPGFAGKRSWATVRKHLLQAAEGKVTRGHALADRLYIPEVFSVEHRDDINARRVAQWTRATATASTNRPLMLLIGEAKEIIPARYGHKAVIKHVPDQAFALDETVYRRMSKRFERELSMWGTSDAVHIVLIATFGLNGGTVPAIEELSLMPVSPQWLPIDDTMEQLLVEQLVRQGRSFTKGLRCQMASQAIASAILTDTPELPTALCIVRQDADHHHAASAVDASAATNHTRCWWWHATREPMPALPDRR